MAERYDIIVVGLGHAGCEAALAAARMGHRTLGVTLRADRIAFMSCNPAIGGTGKGQLVRELDALGGEMGKVADATGTHFRRLNSSRGPAVRASRVLCDRRLYSEEMTRRILQCENLSTREAQVVGLLREQGRVCGVRLLSGEELVARGVVVTAGTFLAAVMHIGDEQVPGGRYGDEAASGLSTSLRMLGVSLGRFKTGTPPRLDGRTIDYSRTTPQPGDVSPRPLSFSTNVGATFPKLRQVACAITHTTPETHRVVRANLSQSPLYCGRIEGRGPRYCPSLEDKVVRFGSRDRHQVYLEPDGLDTNLVYPAGLSTSLPADVQLQALRTIPGLEAVELIRPGYAVEYDFAQPTQLEASLGVRGIPGLFLAGQINGTSGYEEAAVQGFWAGVNAVRQVRGEPPFLLNRSESLIGVLVDDITLRGVDEPYRMFTSRAEHRLLLREENADIRLSGWGVALGLLGREEQERVDHRRELISREVERLEGTRVLPSGDVRAWFEAKGWQPIRAPTALALLLRRPEMSWGALCDLTGVGFELREDVATEVETQVRYQGYIVRQELLASRAEGMEKRCIPRGFPFETLVGLSNETMEALKKAKPSSIGQAARLSGMTPAALNLLVVHVERDRLSRAVQSTDRAQGF
jgi:tRNA uridine 5-carboxymethylaminomethyl modification enzyme